MTDAINVEITTEHPVVAANLTELRYLVFQGMIGETGQSAYELAVELGFEGSEEDWIASLKGERGETLGWDVTDDGIGNVEMTYPDGVINSQKSVLYTEQTLTTAQQEQARENIGAASAADLNGLETDVDALETDVATQSTKMGKLASDDNALELPRLAESSAYGVTFAYNSETGAYELSGTATATFYHTASKGMISSLTARKPPAGVYRLELSADGAVDSTSVWGSLYYSKTTDMSQHIETDATWKTAEIYLDGDMMVDARWHIKYGTNVTGVNLRIALRRIGAPELGELFVWQADQMQALKRKMLGVTRMLRYAYNTQKALEKVFELPLVSDADNAVRSGYVMFARYNGDTLNSPYKQGITDNMQQGAIVGFANGSYAIQVALRYAGNPKLYVRSGTYSSSLNNGEGGYAFNPWLLIQTATA